jgi:hypothetical protein
MPELPRISGIGSGDNTEWNAHWETIGIVFPDSHSHHSLLTFLLFSVLRPLPTADCLLVPAHRLLPTAHWLPISVDPPPPPALFLLRGCQVVPRFVPVRQVRFRATEWVT